MLLHKVNEESLEGLFFQLFPAWYRQVRNQSQEFFALLPFAENIWKLSFHCLSPFQVLNDFECVISNVRLMGTRSNYNLLPGSLGEHIK